MSKGQSNRLEKLEARIGTKIRKEIIVRQLKAGADKWIRNDGKAGTFSQLTASLTSDDGLSVIFAPGDEPPKPPTGVTICLPDNHREDTLG